MLTFIARRILYSIPVLIATSFLIFAGVSLIGDPLGGLKVNPLASQETIDHVKAEKHLNDPIPVQYGYWVLDRAQHLAIPVMVLCVLNLAVYSRFMRASLLEVVNTDYVRTARAKGLTEQKVTMKHAVRNALIPVVTLAALNFGALIGGAIVTEQIFQLDGMGNYFIQNLLNTDIYPIMAWLMVVAVPVIFFNLIADILYGVLDPRVRYE